MDEYYMREALKEAQKAYNIEEIPVGAVVVLDGEIIGRGYNRNRSEKNPLYHAEMVAIDQAVRTVGEGRLPEAELYVTLEPCAMCAGAIVLTRFRRVVLGAMDEKRGVAGSVMNLLQEEHFNHRADVTSGVLQEECSAILSEFFAELREKKKEVEDKNE